MKRLGILLGVLVAVCAITFVVVIRPRLPRKKQPEPQLTTLTTESTILPRIARSPDAAAATLVSQKTTKAGRTYVFIEPTVRDAARRYPLVFVLHGDGDGAVGLHSAWSFERATGADAFVVYPQAARGGWDLETTTDNPDIRFFADLVDELAAAYPIDRERVFGAGYSRGGFMVNVAACHRPTLFRAISSSAGGAPYSQPSLWPNGYPKCTGQRPVAMLALHGEKDTTVWPDSGSFSAEYWAYVNGCQTDQVETSGYPECRVYRGCPPHKAVARCSIPSLGHWVWSASAEASWTFFERM